MSTCQLNDDVVRLILEHVAAPLSDRRAEQHLGFVYGSLSDTLLAFIEYLKAKWTLEGQLFACMQVSRRFYTLALPLLYENIQPVPVSLLQLLSRGSAVVETRLPGRLVGWLAAPRSRPALATFVKSMRVTRQTTLGKILSTHLGAFRSLQHLELSVQCFMASPPLYLAARDLARIASLALTDVGDLDAGSGPAFDLGTALCAVLDLSHIESVAIRNWWMPDSAIFSWLSSLPPSLTSIRMRDADVFWKDLVRLIAHHGPSLLSLQILAQVSWSMDDPPNELPLLAQACPRLLRLGWDTYLHVHGDPDIDDDEGAVLPSDQVLAQLLSAGHPTLEEVALEHQPTIRSNGCHCDLLAEGIADVMGRAPGSFPFLRRVIFLSDSFAKHNVSMELTFGLERLHSHGLELIDGTGERWSPKSPCATLGIASLFEL